MEHHAKLALDLGVVHPLVVLVEAPSHRRKLRLFEGDQRRLRRAEQLGGVGEHILQRRRLVVGDIEDMGRLRGGRGGWRR